MPPHHAPARRSAFTLIELLVVVAILVILIAILLPALSGARELSKKSVCASNLHQIGVSIRMYAGEHEQALPWRVSEWFAANWWTPSDRLQGGDPGYNGTPSMDPTALAALVQRYGVPAKLFMCPAGGVGDHCDNQPEAGAGGALCAPLTYVNEAGATVMIRYNYQYYGPVRHANGANYDLNPCAPFISVKIGDVYNGPTHVDRPASASNKHDIANLEPDDLANMPLMSDLAVRYYYATYSAFWSSHVNHGRDAGTDNATPTSNPTPSGWSNTLRMDGSVSGKSLTANYVLFHDMGSYPWWFYYYR